MSKEILTCPECNGNVLRDPYKAEEICSECGLVLMEKGFRERNGFSISGKKDLEREIKGMNIVRQSTLKYTQTYNKSHYRLLKTDSHKLNLEKAKLKAISKVNQLCSKFNVSHSIKEKTILLFHKAHNKGLARGRTIEVLVASCLYYCCKENGFCLTIQELAKAIDVEGKKIHRYITLLHQNFKLVKKVLSPIYYLSKFISDLGLDYAIEKQSSEIINQFPNNCQIGKDPKGICAGAISLICRKENINITQKSLSEISGVSRPTLRSRVKDIGRFLLSFDELELIKNQI